MCVCVCRKVFPNALSTKVTVGSQSVAMVAGLARKRSSMPSSISQPARDSLPPKSLLQSGTGLSSTPAVSSSSTAVSSVARATLSLTSTVSSATVQANPESGKVSSVSTDVPLSGERRTHSMPTCGETPPTQSSIEEAPPTMSAGGEAPPLKLAGEKQTREMESVVTKQDIPTETPPTETPPTATSAEVAPLIAGATKRKASPTESSDAMDCDDSNRERSADVSEVEKMEVAESMEKKELTGEGEEVDDDSVEMDCDTGRGVACDITGGSGGDDTVDEEVCTSGNKEVPESCDVETRQVLHRPGSHDANGSGTVLANNSSVKSVNQIVGEGGATGKGVHQIAQSGSCTIGPVDRERPTDGVTSDSGIGVSGGEGVASPGGSENSDVVGLSEGGAGNGGCGLTGSLSDRKRGLKEHEDDAGEAVVVNGVEDDEGDYDNEDDIDLPSAKRVKLCADKEEVISERRKVLASSDLKDVYPVITSRNGITQAFPGSTPEVSASALITTVCTTTSDIANSDDLPSSMDSPKDVSVGVTQSFSLSSMSSGFSSPQTNREAGLNGCGLNQSTSSLPRSQPVSSTITPTQVNTPTCAESSAISLSTSSSISSPCVSVTEQHTSLATPTGVVTATSVVPGLTTPTGASPSLDLATPTATPPTQSKPSLPAVSDLSPVTSSLPVPQLPGSSPTVPIFSKAPLTFNKVISTQVTPSQLNGHAHSITLPAATPPLFLSPQKPSRVTSRSPSPSSQTHSSSSSVANLPANSVSRRSAPPPPSPIMRPSVSRCSSTPPAVTREHGSASNGVLSSGVSITSREQSESSLTYKCSWKCCDR